MVSTGTAVAALISGVILGATIASLCWRVQERRRQEQLARLRDLVRAQGDDLVSQRAQIRELVDNLHRLNQREHEEIRELQERIVNPPPRVETISHSAGLARMNGGLRAMVAGTSGDPSYARYARLTEVQVREDERVYEAIDNLLGAEPEADPPKSRYDRDEPV